MIQGLRPNRSVIVGLDLNISHLATHWLLRTRGKILHGEHGEDGADGKHVGQEAEEIGLAWVRSNVMKVSLPVVVLLQEVEERSGAEQSKSQPKTGISKATPTFVPPAINLPIIPSGCRTDQKTQGAVDVELANILVLGPGDLLELRCLGNGLLPVFLSTGGDIC